MEISSLFARLNIIMDLIRHNPERVKVVEHLSEYACPDGEVAGVTTSYVDENGVIVLEYAVGFAVDLTADSKIKMTDDHPRAITLRGMQVTYLDISREIVRGGSKSFLGNFSDYSTSVGMPISAGRLYGLALHAPMSKVAEHRDYFDCLRSILATWESVNHKPGLKSSRDSQLLNRDLTERQRVIVQLIKAGGTNLSISVTLGFSESLIRQETIIIYKKLGVNGRKELAELEE